jgi:hypothetical protein
MFAKGDSLYYGVINDNGMNLYVHNIATRSNALFTLYFPGRGLTLVPSMTDYNGRWIVKNFGTGVGYEMWISSATVSTSAPEAPLPLEAHPNPFTDRIVLPSDATGALLTLTDAQGRVLRQEEVTAVVIPTDDLPTGMYTVRLRQKDKVFLKQMIKVD